MCWDIQRLFVGNKQELDWWCWWYWCGCGEFGTQVFFWGGSGAKVGYVIWSSCLEVFVWQTSWTLLSRYKETFKYLIAFLKLIKGCGEAQGAEQASVSVLKAWSQTPTSTWPERLICALFHFVQSLDSITVFVPQRWHSCWSNSFVCPDSIPTIKMP